MSEAAQRVLRAPALSDLVALTKPGITVFALLTAAGAASLAPGEVAPALWLPLLAGTAFIVGAANTFNMYLERESDCKMARTKGRPLPAQRLQPEVALAFGVVLAVISVPLLTFGVNPLTGLLGAIALISYVMMYTPLKQRTTASLLVGSVPGAMPALMGWTAMSGRLEVGGLVIFGVMFMWQIPHFQAIAMYRRTEYNKAGHRIVPTVYGDEITRYSILFYLAAQIQLSILLFPLGVSGSIYLVIAVILGAIYFGYALYGLVTRAGPRWARRLFLFSLIYLPLLFIAMVADGMR